jgi:hypothetical protein
LNNCPTIWRWDDAAEEYAYLRHLTDDEHRLVENGSLDEVMEREWIAER